MRNVKLSIIVTYIWTDHEYGVPSDYIYTYRPDHVLQVILFVYSLTVHISVSSPLESVVRIVII